MKTQIEGAAPAKRSEKLNRRGLTLVEVLAATLIMGGAVTMALVAQAQGLRQLKVAERTLLAEHLARELLATWRIEKDELSKPDEGEIDDLDGWRWQRRSKPVKLQVGIELTEVVLRLEYRAAHTERPWQREFHWLILEAQQTDKRNG